MHCPWTCDIQHDDGMVMQLCKSQFFRRDATFNAKSLIEGNIIQLIGSISNRLISIKFSTGKSPSYNNICVTIICCA
jgi:hypothetical protein